MTASGLPTSSPPERVTLPGGLQLGFIALPTGSQAAALVRVHAGAHTAALRAALEGRGLPGQPRPLPLAEGGASLFPSSVRAACCHEP